MRANQKSSRTSQKQEARNLRRRLELTQRQSLRFKAGIDPADDGHEVTIIRRLVPDAVHNIKSVLLEAALEDLHITEAEYDFCRKVGLNV